MGVRVKHDTQREVNASEMLDGQLAVITDWICRDYIGRVVQRVGKLLFTVGGGSGNAFGDKFFDHRNNDCRVRILPPGTELVIE